jgi:hypothetical protein
MASTTTQYITTNAHLAVAAPGQTFSLLSSAGGATSIATATVAGTTGTSVTLACEVGGNSVKLYRLTSDGAITAGAVTMQGSNDGTTWFDTGSAITPGNGAGTVASLATDTQAWKFIRARVSTTLVGAGNIVVTVHI